MQHEQGRADRATLALSFSILAMLFSAGTMFFYNGLSQLKTEEIRLTVDSRNRLSNQMYQNTKAIEELAKAARALREAVEDESRATRSGAQRP